MILLLNELKLFILKRSINPDSTLHTEAYSEIDPNYNDSGEKLQDKVPVLLPEEGNKEALVSHKEDIFIEELNAVEYLDVLEELEEVNEFANEI